MGEVVGGILAEAHSSCRVGLLGFSQGGFLATAAAADDVRISALVVFYGANRNFAQDEISHRPPLFEFDGDADRVVPLAEALALVDPSRSVVARGTRSS